MRTVLIRTTMMGAVLVLGAGPALADTFPGTLCTSEGATTKYATGMQVNGKVGSGTTFFHCPLAHARYGGNVSTPLTIRVNYRTSNYQNLSANPPVRFECLVKTVMTNNQTIDTLTLSGFTTSVVGEYDSIEGQITLPLYGSVNMRCSVPNVYAGGAEAGIVSYSVF